MSKVIDAVKSALPGGSNKAAWADKGSKTLRVDTAELPVPGDDDVVVKNHAIAVNPVDWKILDYELFIKNWPTVLGVDIAGEVHEVGKNVTRFKKGDRVFAHCMALVTQQPQNGGFQHYTSVPAAVTAKIPSNLSYNEASVLPLAVDTAGHGLYDSKENGFFGLSYPSLTPTPNGKTLVIWGGSSSVGAVTIQLATASGAKVVATASKHNHDFVESLGASAVLDYNDASVVDDVVKAVQTIGGEFIGIYDAISTDDSRKHAIPITERLGGGIIASTLPTPESGFPANVKFAGVFAVNPVNHPLWTDYLTPALEQGKLRAVPTPLVVGKGLEHVQEGLDKNKAGVSAKKVVIEL